MLVLRRALWIYRVQHGSTDVLEQLLSHEDCDMDPKNRIARATPLHLAVQLEPKDLRLYVVESLLEAGADISCVICLDRNSVR